MLMVLLSAAAGSAAIGQALPAGSADVRMAHWREDLLVLTATLSAKGHTVSVKQGITTRGQMDFDKLYPHFQADIDALSGGIPQLSDGEIVLRLMRIIASAKVDHNQVDDPIGLGFFARLPLTFEWFAEGLAVVNASKEYEAALGALVLKIGEKTPEQVLTDLTPYISHENDFGLRKRSLPLLRCRIILEEIRVVNSDGLVALTLQRPDGTTCSLKAKTIDPLVSQISMSAGLHIPALLWESRPDERYYWYRRLEDGSLYVQYNVCMNDPKLRFSDFATKVLADVDSHSVKRVVIDLRRNGGGDSRVIGPLKNGLHGRLNKLGHVYVLTGPGTASSAMDNAIELRRSLRATLVGEPTSEKPSGYGEVKIVTLPNSKLKISYSTDWSGSKTDPRDALAPDVLVPRKLLDALAGRDAALEAVLSMQ